MNGLSSPVRADGAKFIRFVRFSARAYINWPLVDRLLSLSGLGVSVLFRPASTSSEYQCGPISVLKNHVSRPIF
jgi:hypothetical protein